MKWKIYYTDGSTYSGADAYEAPGRGALVVVHAHDQVGRELNCKEHFYWWTGSRWLGGDRDGLMLYLLTPGPKKVVFGEVVSNDAFNSALQVALHDPDFPPKSARLFGERY